MSNGLKLSLKMGQHLAMTPQLQQAIKLLQLNHLELAEQINQELMENPMLEEGGEEGDTPAGEESMQEVDGAEGDAATASDPVGDDLSVFERSTERKEELIEGKEPGDDFNWEQYVEEYSSGSTTSPSMKESGEEGPSFESFLAKSTSLEEHLIWQLNMVSLTDEELEFGKLVIGNLSDDGYFTGTVEPLAIEAKMDPEDAEEVLKIIQGFDPVGIASRSLQECLLIHARLLEPRDPLVEQIVTHHLAELEKRNFPVIAKALNETLERIAEATRLIMEFEPKPGRAYQVPENQYISPDIYVYKVKNEFVVSLNDDGIPRLRISNHYKSIIQQKKNAPSAAPATEGEKDTRKYVEEKLRAAIWLIKSIHNRQKTIFKVTEAILARQKDFFEKGVQHLKPMVLKDIATDVSMHESTISRVTTNKYVHTPMGIFELKYFFNSSIGASDGGDSHASEAVKDRIKRMVVSEDTKNPFSDEKIAEILKKDGIDIARRTVAKYREQLGILSSSKRKRYC